MAHNLEMINGQASFVSANGMDAWHRLGVVVPDEGLTAEQVMGLARLGGWNVRKRPVFTEDESGRTLAVPNKVAIVRDNPVHEGQVDVIDVMGKDYTIIQNEQHAAFLNALVDEGALFSTAGSLYENGRQVFITMRLPGHVAIGGKGGDQIENYIAAVNSHDGSTAFQVMVTPVRVVCANTLNLAMRDHSHIFKVRHSGKGLDGAVLAARQVLDVTFEYLDEFKELANMLVQEPMSDTQFEAMLEKAFLPEEGAAAITRARKKIDEMGELFAAAGTQERIRDTKWAGLNAMTEWWDHHSPTRGEDSEAEATRARKALMSTSFKDKALALVLAA